MGDRAKPFLKWAGGKTRLARLLASMAPPFTGRYFEPFMGSAALFFELAPERAVLSDANEDLVVCFQEVARDPYTVMDLLDRMPNTREAYMAVRRQDPTKLSGPERAARVIYLNKTGFRGLWRVNRRGEFNVPYGEYSRPYYNRENLLRASKALAVADIRVADFEEVMGQAVAGDFIYLDPPYVPDRKWGDFRRYT
ncbi:MAG TPA: Dam family site-specific DNA-(adenine-N6)-methyltransferase, partial [Actinomycetota bacterium]|nr:Dam family site-specific DNA-(adenine-N6)-methyltransferase [Actinomycetota bacterium]